jgi:light-regulated signal transduction histidine kinase (bacteriophytochrome)
MNSIRHELVSGEGRVKSDVELQATVKRLEAFSSHVAHDLRDALSGMTRLAEIAYTALDERQDCDSALRSLALIAQQGHRSSHMLRGLLRLAQTRDASLQIDRVDVQILAEEVAQEMATCHGAHSMPQLCVRPMPVVTYCARCSPT